MEFRNTNESTGTSEIRRRVGLQFFAEGEGAEDAADMDEAADSGFLDGLTGDDAENQRDDAADTQEDAPEDAENQRGDGQDEVAETQDDQNIEETETPENTQETPPEMATLTVNGNRIQVPAAAVGSLAEALGTDTASIGALLQKGMNYERKGADEMRILGEYAKAAGVDLKTYVRGLDNGLREHKLAKEVETLRAQHPNKDENILRAMAEQKLTAERERENQAQQQREQQLSAQRERIRQSVEQTRQMALQKDWEQYFTITGQRSVEEIPERVVQLHQAEGLSPLAALYKYEKEQAEQQLAIERKQNENKSKTPGSMQGAGDHQDAFLAGLLGE